MTNQNKDLTALARRFHSDLLDRIRQYLNGRGIPNEMIDLNLIGWNGWRITIPIFAAHGNVTFFRFDSLHDVKFHPAVMTVFALPSGGPPANQSCYCGVA